MGATQSTTRPCVVDTGARGKLHGIEKVSTETGKPVYQRFTRIPYAQPPIKELRWRLPVPLPEDHSFDIDCTTFGAACPQPVYTHVTCALENPKKAPEPEFEMSEDCLYMNVWVPAGEAPRDGWPVQVFLHGGWLQVGNAMQSNEYDPFDLFLHTSCPRIIVSPTYRLNVFGFLASSDIAHSNDNGPATASVNFGFHDQRLALEWVQSNIALLGGDSANISVGGLSAGANSTFFQLYYDTFCVPPGQRIIRRAYFWSNAVGIQPNAFDAEFCEAQLDELIDKVCSGQSEPRNKMQCSADRVDALRKVPAEQLVAGIGGMSRHTFRAVTDGSFIDADFLSNVVDGTFGRRLAENGTSILVGEVSDESEMYKMVNPPTDLESLRTQLGNYYPPKVVAALLSPEKKVYKLPGEAADAIAWADIYGYIVADCQVHATVRGFHKVLTLDSKPAYCPVVHRYRIEWRAKGLDEWIDPKVKVCHSADMPMWWMSACRAGYSSQDIENAKIFLEPFDAFLRGENVTLEADGLRKIRLLRADGTTKVQEDERWDERIRIWDAVIEAQLGSRAANLAY